MYTFNDVFNHILLLNYIPCRGVTDVAVAGCIPSPMRYCCALLNAAALNKSDKEF